MPRSVDGKKFDDTWLSPKCSIKMDNVAKFVDGGSGGIGEVNEAERFSGE